MEDNVDLLKKYLTEQEDDDNDDITTDQYLSDLIDVIHKLIDTLDKEWVL